MNPHLSNTCSSNWMPPIKEQMHLFFPAAARHHHCGHTTIKQDMMHTCTLLLLWMMLLFGALEIDEHVCVGGEAPIWISVDDDGWSSLTTWSKMVHLKFKFCSRSQALTLFFCAKSVSMSNPVIHANVEMSTCGTQEIKEREKETGCRRNAPQPKCQKEKSGA